MAQNYINKTQIKVGNNTSTYIVEPTLYSAASTSDSGGAYTATLDNFGLTTGATVQIKFAATNKASATLNVNSTGAKTIFYNNAAIVANTLKANHTYTLVYDGTQWQLVGDIDTNTTYANGTGITIGSGNAINHSNSVTAQTTQGFYPIKIDAQGHINAYGTAITPVTSVNGHTGSSVSVTASDLGLSKAMRFIGVATVAITDGSTTDPVISGYTFGTNGASATAGDVVIDKDSAYEYVWSTAKKWERLGGDSSYKIVQTAVSSATAETTTATTFVHSVTQDTNGVITVKTRPLPTYNNYSHPTGDGNLHVPATGTSNNGKFLKAGSTAGSISWASLAASDIPDISGTYLKRAGGEMTGTAVISWANSGSWGSSSATFPLKRGGLYWSGTSDWIDLFAEETVSDKLNLVINFGDDTNPSLVLRDRGTDKITLCAGSNTITAGTFSGNLTGNVTGNVNGNATTATEFSSNATVTLTGDTTGTSDGSKKSWSVPTTTSYFTKLENLGANKNENDYHGTPSKIKFYTHVNSSRPTNCPEPSYNSGLIVLSTGRSVDDTFQIEYSINTGDIYTRSWLSGPSEYPPWKTILNSTNYTTYTVKKDGTGASGSWGISVTGNAATATALTSNAGGNEQPVYFSDGKPVATSYSLAASIGSGTANFLPKYTDAHAIDNSSICNIPNISYSTVTPNYTSGGEQYYKAWLTYICNNYSTADIYIGTANPNSKGPILGNIYNVGDKNSTTGLPRYSTFWFNNLAGSLEAFGTNNYNYYHYTYLNDSNYTNYTVTKTGTGASGTWGISVTGSSGSCTGNAATATKATQDGEGNVISSTYLKLSGGKMTGGLEIAGHIAGDTGSSGHGLYGGGGYHNAYNNIILHGDASTGSSGIAFVSDKVSSNGTVTNINQPSDRAFIQYHAYGVTTPTAEGTNPTLATSGEQGRLVIGIGNDAGSATSGDMVWLQSNSHTDLIHQITTNSYVIPDTGNTTGSVGGTTTPVYVDAGVIKAGTALGASAYHADSYFALASHGTHVTTESVKTALGVVGTTAKKFLKDTGSWTQVDWGDLTGKPSTFSPSAHEHNRLDGIGRLSTAAAIPYNPSAQQGYRMVWNIYDSTSRANDATNSPSFDAGVINLPWDWGGYNGQIAISNTIKDNTRMQIRSASHIDNGENANPRYTPNYGAWREVVTATKATKVGDTNKPVYINATGQATAISYTIEKSVPSNAVFTDHYAWGDITGKPIEFITNSSALNSNGWKTLGGRSNGSKIAISYASSSSATWNSENYSATIVFGCSDTKGFLDCGYSSAIVTFGGGSVAGSTDNAPKWYFKMSGTSGKTYTLPADSKTLCATDGSNASGSWDISVTGNAATATKFSSARTVQLTGAVTGSVSADGSSGWSVATTITGLTRTTRFSKNSDNTKIEDVTGFMTNGDTSFLHIVGFCPPTMYRTSGDMPAPYGIGFGNGSESGGIIPIGQGDKLEEIRFYGANSGPTIFTFGSQVWEGNTYDSATSNRYATYLSINSKNGNLSTSGTINASGTVNALAYGVSNTDSTTGKGISLHNGPTGGAPTYGLMFAGTGTFGTHGAVTSDWATYFTMSDTTNRGWIFRRGSTNVASIDGTGKLYLGYAANTNNPGVYWNPYVESASDGSDVSAIYQIKSGVAGGTELRITQANDSGDVINICSPYYIYMNSKRIFTINDSWFRINENSGFSSGVYFGSGTGGVVRTDNQFQIGDSGSKFYANSSGNGYFSNSLGIAGTNANYKLHVNGATNSTTYTINTKVRLEWNETDQSLDFIFA